MDIEKDPQYFSERSQLLSRESAFYDLAFFLSLASAALIGFLIYFEIRTVGIDPGSSKGFFLILLAGIAALNILIFFVIRHSRESWLAIETEAGLDKVTGVMSRIHFEKLLEEELRRGGRYHYPISVCYLDLDDFAAINENLGRRRGDEILKKFGDLLRGTSRFADCVARYQNDEFCVLLPHTDIVKAEKFIARISKETQERLGSGFSGGVTSYQAGESKNQFMTRALSSLTQAKSEGFNKIRYAVAENLTDVSR